MALCRSVCAHLCHYLLIQSFSLDKASMRDAVSIVAVTIFVGDLFPLDRICKQTGHGDYFYSRENGGNVQSR